MAYDEEEAKSRRIVVDTPAARREVTHSERRYTPASEGVSTATIAVLVIVACAVVILFLLLFMNRPANDNANLAATQPTPAPQTTIIQQPAQQPPVIVQQPAPNTQAPPVIVNPPASTGNSGTDDLSIQAAIDKRLLDDPNLAQLDVTATVADGKVTLSGSVKAEQLKREVEKAVRTIKGVKSVDNKIAVATA